MGMENRKDTKYIIFMRVVCAVSVLLLHTNSCFWWFHGGAEETYWKSANVIECLFYYAVPLFYMISGITLMDFYDRYSLKDFFVKRFKRVVLPFLVWSLIGAAEKVWLDWISPEQMSLKLLYEGITGAKFVPVYWFFTSIIIVYLSLPLYAAVDQEKRKTVFTYLVIGGFTLNILIPFIKNVWSLEFNTPYTVTAAAGVLIWPPLGWLLHNCSPGKKTKRVLYLLAILGFAMHLFGTCRESMKLGTVSLVFKGYENVPGFLYAIGAFLLLKEIGSAVMKGRAARFFTRIAPYTLEYYLMQFIFLDLAEEMLSTTVRASLLYRLGAPFLILPVITLLTWCMRKIPVIREIVP